MRHLPDNTGVWSAFELAGMTADAVEDAETSSSEKRSVCCCSHGMTRSSGCSVCLDAPASHVACRLDDAPWNIQTKAHITVHVDCVVVFDVVLRVSDCLSSRDN